MAIIYMLQHPKAFRGFLFLIFTTVIVLGFYTIIDNTAFSNFRISVATTTANFIVLGQHGTDNKVNNVTVIDVDEVVAELHLQNLTCSRYFGDFRSDVIQTNRQPLVLYQPPCPLGNFPDFRFLINRDLCGDKDDVYMLILVGSHPNHLSIRNVIRQSLGHPEIENLKFKIAFTFGYLRNVSQQKMLEDESRKYNDIIQGSFMDSYHNVTLRDLMALRWSWQYCPQARIVMRMDDDVAIDIYRLIDSIEKKYVQLTTSVGCFQMLVKTPVFRDGQYAVSREEHPGDIYDPYCQGWMYILTPKMAFNLDVASLKVKPYWMNDAYITGTLVKSLGSSPVDINVNYTVNAADLVKNKNKWPPVYNVAPTTADANLTLALHQNFKKYAKQMNLPKFQLNITSTTSTTTAINLTATIST
ncbi:hypothetical protein CHUAL_008490 [Chamberlinius hualienensis]